MEQFKFKKAEINEGYYKAFYSHATNRVHKKFPHEGVFRIYRNQSGALMGRLTDMYEVLIVEDFLHFDMRHKIFNEDGFTIDRWDIQCHTPDTEQPSSSLNHIESSLKMKNTFTPASCIHPYRRRSPLLKKTPVLLEQSKASESGNGSFQTPPRVFHNQKGVDSKDGYFQTYGDKEKDATAFILAKLSEDDSDSRLLRYGQFLEFVGVNSDIKSGQSQLSEEVKLGIQENMFWIKSVVQKSVIPKNRLLELVQQYPNDEQYLAGVFDGLVLGGHRLVGLEDVEFRGIVKHMIQK